MQRWEYKAFFVDCRQKKNILIVENVNGSSAQKGKTLEDLLNELGEQGWEIVSSELSSIGIMYHYTFKRSKQ